MAISLSVKEDRVHHPIAVFDSGLGGLSLVRHLRQLCPAEHVVYFGDTARVPWGTKSGPTVTQFALEAARFLQRFDPKIMVVACNTASALALDALREQLPVPIVGVVEPGARAAVALAAGRPIAVIGTEATISSGSYERAVHAVSARHPLLMQACPLFVPIVEEGRGCDDEVVRVAVQMYLAPLREAQAGVLVLGCTHYPLLREAIEGFMGPAVSIVDSGRETSLVVQALLEAAGGLRPAGQAGSLRCFVSDNPARFHRIGSRFLQEELQHVELVEPEQYIECFAEHRAQPHGA